MAQEHNEHTIHQERLLNALLKVFGTVGRDLAVTGGEERGMLEEGVQMACVVFLLGREGSASEAWEDFNTTTPPPALPSLTNPVPAQSHQKRQQLPQLPVVSVLAGRCFPVPAKAKGEAFS